MVIGSAGYAPCSPLDASEDNEGKIHGGNSKKRITSLHTEGSPILSIPHTLQVRCLNACVHSSAP